MQNDEHIVRYTASELDRMLAEGKSETDWARVDAMTDEELEASIDFEDEGTFDFGRAQAGLPEPRQEITVHLDRDIIAWFREQGPAYESRMNAVLRSFVEAQKQRERDASEQDSPDKKRAS